MRKLKIGTLEKKILYQLYTYGQLTSSEIKRNLRMSYYPAPALQSLIKKKMIYKRAILRKEISRFHQINYYLTQKGLKYISKLDIEMALRKR